MYRTKRSRSDSRTSTVLNGNVQAPSTSDHDSEDTEQERESKRASRGDHDASPGSPAHAEKSEETAIKSIRATDLALGLRRIPAGFYTVVQHSDLEWRTENKRSSMDSNVVEWDGPIPIPSDLSAIIGLKVYASFEFCPMLGNGELLRELTVTVEQLLERSAKYLPFVFLPKDGDVVSPCSSFLVTVSQRKRQSSDPSALRFLNPHRSITECSGQLEIATDNGHSALSRFRKHGDKRDLERSIEHFEHALRICPLAHPCCAAAQSNLAMAKFILCRVDSIEDFLDVPLRLYCNALSSRPVGHVDRPLTLIQLAFVHFARFEKRRNEADVAQAEALLCEAMDLLPADTHGNQAVSRMLQLYSGRKTAQVQPPTESAMGQDFPPSSANGDPWALSVQLLRRYGQFGDLGDLQQAIAHSETLVKLTSLRDPRYPTALLNFGVALLDRFRRLGDLGDLEEAISRLGGAVQMTPDGHPDKPSQLNNLGISFVTRFKRLGELEDLEQATSRFRDAVQLMPDSHPDKPVMLNNLGNSFLARFKRLGELGDLERAISTQEDAVQLTPDSHPDKPCWLNNLDISLRTRFEHLGELGDLEQAISTQGDALAWLGLSLPHRFRELIRGADIVREAAGAAMESGYPETAAEWLEQGHSVVWGELFQLRSSYDELFVVYPDYARRLRELSTELEEAGTAREQLLSPLLGIGQAEEKGATGLSEQLANRHRTLAIERDRLLQKIRELPGFERFLLHKEFSRIRASARSGPIVILNAANSRCDALVVLTDVENVIHVLLPNFTLERCEVLQTSVKSLVRDAHTIPLGERVGRCLPRDLVGQWESILSSLWKCVVKPVLDSLAIVAPGKHSRIFWCPTGPFTFLPIHAAGLYHTEYSQPGHKVSDFVISSYVPTLSLLAPSPELDVPPSNTLRFLAVRQPLSDGLSRLPGVIDELRHIKEIISKSPSAGTTLQESSRGTVEEVLGLMRDADWVHFACHGIQDAANPTNSGLCLAHERRLRISDIIALSRPHGGLAFLSACHTATGDKVLSDEAIHIAAGMLFAGYGGVVGTMWSISDRLAPEVSRGVYEQLFSKGRKPDYREAVRALQDVVGRLRTGGVPFSEWIPFIHVGL